MTTTTRSAAKKQDQSTSTAPGEEAQPGSKHKTQETAAPPSPKRVKNEEGDEREQGKAQETSTQGGKAKSDKQHQQKQENGSEDTKPPKEEKPSTDSDSDSTPASILEKGLIYFFIRPRVDISTPTSINDIARTHIALRPIPHNTKTLHTTTPNPPNDPHPRIRLCAIPKKTLPLTGHDRWLGFVENPHTSLTQLRDRVLAESTYETKTAGTRHAPQAKPLAEGVYALTSTGKASHLVLLEEFRSLRWVPTQPKHLDYENAQFLLVGESSGTEKALAPQEEDEKEGKAEPAEEMEELEEEDAKRMKGLGKDDSDRIFADLQADAGDYPELQTTF
ncbi:hypothetical protein CHGG_06072 [Chaetomium globosum CBS 148.51]|uniref:Uncharacterized protein n=1 Tax=Chaetomium globosum (strain ATCC 6205 / CBS 148.51 / DSM 1962 / NBRC 6347 / NRRL 1970) TaxID=306901 RepID=Q2H5J3_CHAGB|nr:uncharacterized protein CHGG_06072 [Chaetomium globosum CBS 148.51]EAQ89453.1 hypothetical protein CHGG_06072 [Chaetomium globosum CBS 148.51]